MTAEILTNAGVRPTRAQIALWLALLVLTLFLSLRDYESFQVGVERDDAEYIILARSLLGSNHYGLINQPGQPGESRFPFGYPLVIAALLALLPNNWDALKLVSLAATLVNGSILFWSWHWLSRRPHWWGLCVAGLYLLSPYVISQTRMVLSEPIFTTFCLASIIAITYAARRTAGPFWLCFTIVTLVLLVFTRTLGWVIITCLCVYLLPVRRQAFRMQILGVAGGMLLLVGLVVTLTPVTARDLVPSLYVKRFSAVATGSKRDVPDRNTPFPILLAQYGLSHLRSDIPSTLVPLGGGAREQEFVAETGASFLPDALRLAIVAMIGLGFVQWWRTEGASGFMLPALGYLVALFLWEWSGPRLLYPIMPQLYFAFLIGIEALTEKIARTIGPSRTRISFAGTVISTLCLLAISSYKSLTIDDSRVHTGDLSLRTAWLKQHTPDEAVIMTREPVIDYLYGERHTVPYPGDVASPGDVANYLERGHVDYVLIAPRLEWQTRYVPGYDGRTNQMLARMNELAADGRVALIYSPGVDLIQIFQAKSSSPRANATMQSPRNTKAGLLTLP